MVRLSDAFRDARTMGELSFAAGETVGNSLKASRVGYGTIDPDTDTLFVERDWTASGVRSLEGETPLRQFGSYMDDWKVGETVCIHDVYEDPRTAAGAQALEALSARAFVGVPVLENGRLVAVVFVNSSHARRWTSAELAFIKEVADRARTAVERARSEAALADTAEHLKLMVLELKHRVKNSLAIVQSIAAQSLRGDVTLSQAREAFMQRVSALAVAHDIITRDQWEDLSLDEVARGVLEPLVGGSERLILAGPRFALKPTSGLALALAFHELGTNALKYGALSVPTGHVAIHWAAVAPNSRDVLIRWSEHNGPTVTPPTKQGFGTRLLTRALASELGGQVTLEYPQAGVVCTITGMIRVDEPLHT
jgi:two-component sensor histidine kinase